MSLPYMPGWGDTLRENLPSLSRNIQKIVNPNIEHEEMLKDLALKNPELLDELTMSEQASPGSLAKLYGQKAADFLGTRQLTQKTQQRLKAGDLAIKGQEQGLELGEQAKRRNELGIVGDQTENELKAIRLKDDQDKASYWASLPEEMRNKAHFQQSFGMSEEQFKEVERRGKLQIESKDLSNLNGQQLYEKYKSKDGIGGEALLGLFLNSPQAGEELMRRLAFDDQNKLRRDLAATAHSERKTDFTAQLALQEASAARARGITDIPAYLKSQGIDPELIPSWRGGEVSDARVAAVTAQNKQIELQRIAKVNGPINSALKNYMAATRGKTRSKEAALGAIVALNGALQAAGKDFQYDMSLGVFGGQKPGFVDSQGNKLTFDQVADMLGDPTLSKTIEETGAGGDVSGGADRYKSTSNALKEEDLNKRRSAKRTELKNQHPDWTNEQLMAETEKLVPE